MVLAGLLTEHPRGSHGDGGASGDQSSLWQGAGTGTFVDPDLEITAVAERLGILRYEVLLEGFRKTM